MKNKVLFVLAICGLILSSAAWKTPQADEYELQLISGPAESMQKAMKKFVSAYPDIEVSMHATTSGYGLRAGGCMEKAKVEELKLKLGKDYPASTIEKCE